MERYQSLLWENEVEINSRTAVLSLYELLVVACIYVMDSCGLFTVYSFATQWYWKVGLALLLVTPWLLVRVFRLRGRCLKYVIMSCSVLASGLCYVIFNAQAQLLLLFPTVLVTLYYNSVLSYYTCGLTVAVLFLSYLIAGYLLLPPRFQNPYGFRYVMVDTAIPQALYYICFAFLVQLLNRRTLGLLLNVYKTSSENEVLNLEKETAEMRGRLDERERISRDIHNSVGHTITAAIFALEAAKLQRATDPAAADEKTERAIQRMRESMDTIRNSVRVLDDRNVLTLQELLKMLTLCCRQTELDAAVYIETDYSGVSEAEEETALSSGRIGFLYGMVQECVTNGMKHGDAEHIRLRVSVMAANLVVEVWNDGKVPDYVPSEGFGLRKMRNYAESAGGRLEIVTGYGFTVRMTLPLETL